MSRYEYPAWIVVWAPSRDEADAAVRRIEETEVPGGYITVDDGDPSVEEDDDEDA